MCKPLGLVLSRQTKQNVSQPGTMVRPWNPSTGEANAGELRVLDSPGYVMRPSLKIKFEEARAVSQW